ncbi:MAG: hypothetical protein AB1480_05625, partial [Nitrospirota bacterium]
ARAYDGELYSEWMSLASFLVNTANDAPDKPTLHSPADGSSIDALNPTLSVENAEDPDLPEADTLTYDFEIYSNGIDSINNRNTRRYIRHHIHNLNHSTYRQHNIQLEGKGI